MKKKRNLDQLNIETFSREWEFSTSTKQRIKRIVSLVGKNQKVLDVGCFDGRISKQIKDQENGVYGIDISPIAVKKAQKLGIKAYVCNVVEKDPPKILNDFDVIVAAEIIEHIIDTDSFIRKLKKLLRKNGNLIITTPNLAGLGSRLSLLLGKMPWMIENDVLPGKSGHVRYFTLDELEILLKRHGFTIEVFTSDTVGVGANLCIPFAEKLLPRLGRSLIVKARKK